MMTIKIVNKPLTPNGELALRKAYDDKLSTTNKFDMWRKHITQDRRLIEDKGKVLQFDVTITIPAYKNPDILREMFLDKNKVLLAEKGAWETDYTTDITIITREVPHG